MANGGRAGMPRDPVENIYYGFIKGMHEGEYLLQVHQFKLVEKADTGFTVEIDIQGEVHRFQSAVNPPHGKFVDVATLTVKGGKVMVTPGDAVFFAVPEAVGIGDPAVAACFRYHEIAEPLGR